MTGSEPELPVSKLADADMRAVPAALLRAGERARQIARETGTAVVVRRDGKLVEERDFPAPHNGNGPDST
ncbi:MAG: hypothetical protein SGJ09_04190 [Phycisphaerae bacterium]|nr:hypothetical protein [Phycisphaerae bacterium]